MRSFIAAAVALVAIAHPALAATWYVTTTGSDSNGGTSTGDAFLTWQRAVTAAAAGDTILISPGTYSSGTVNGVLISAKSGSSGSPITMQGSGGRPILDCSAVTDMYGYCLRVINSNYWVFRDLEFREIPQITAAGWSIGVELVNVNNLLLDRIVTHDHGGAGLSMSGTSSNNTIQYSDSYNNYDIETGGGNADGVSVGNMEAAGSTGNVLLYNRAWSNSDDGFDLWEMESPVTITGSWSFWNGYIPGTGTPAGDGNGFKLGRNDSGPTHVVTRNFAFENDESGFNSNGATGSMQVYANTSFSNADRNFIFDDPANGTHSLTNNLSHAPGVGHILAATGVTQTQNSWNIGGLTITDADFSSVSSTGAAADRNAAGDLPNLAFMHPVNCDIINKSTMNLACCGKTLGAFGRYIEPPVGFRRALPAAAMLGTPPE